MEMTGEYSIAAPRQVVWDALNDAEILKQSIPGCTEMIKTADDAFEAKVSFKIGPVRAKFGGKLAQIGSRLIDATAKKMANDFFARFAEVVAGPAPEEAEAAPPPAEAKPGLPPAIWVGGLIAIVVILLLLFAF